MSHTRRRGGPSGFTCKVSTRRHVEKWKERCSRSRAPILRIAPKRVKPISPYETGWPRPTPEHYRHSGLPFLSSSPSPPLSSSPSPPLSSSTLVIEDPGFFACVAAPSHGAPLPLPFRHPGLDPGSSALLVFSVVGAASNAARPLRLCTPPSHTAVFSPSTAAEGWEERKRAEDPLNDVGGARLRLSASP